MAHEKVYGICENKCQHEVYRKDDADETFLKKTTASSSYAIKNHAISETTYGIGSETLYGHVKIIQSLDVPPSMTAGKALAASAGKELFDNIQYINDQLITRIIALEQRVRALENA